MTVLHVRPTDSFLHASGHNLSRFDRWAVYYVCNRVANRPGDVANPRPDYVRSRNWAPLARGSDDILPQARPLAAE